MKYAVEGIYRNGVVELLEDVPVYKPLKVFVLFREEFNDGYEIRLCPNFAEKYICPAFQKEMLRD